MAKAKARQQEREKPSRREPGPKNRARSIPENYQIRRDASPIRLIFDEADSAKLVDIQQPPAQPEEKKRKTLSRPPTPSRPPRGPRASTPSSTRPVQMPVAPERDFARVANSIVREAVSDGVFTGKSKQLYDFLYSQTRGAIVPVRSIRLSRSRLMQGAGIGSEVTLTKNLNHLKTVGLVTIQEIGGTHGGNEYTVLMPEEVGITPSTPSRGSTPSSPTQFLGGLPPVETRPSRAGLNADREGSSASPNTSFKTINDDDDMRMLLEPLRAAALEIGGESAISSGRWAEVGKLLAEELETAAARAGQVNNVPAFFAEHLRRALGRAGKSAKAESGRKGEGQGRRKPTSEERLKQIIEATRALHVGDMGYSEEDLISDVIFKAKRAGLQCDEALVRNLLDKES